MPKDLMAILDNSMYCINQDYEGNTRLGHQIAGVKSVVDKILNESTESTVGAMVMRRGTTTKIVSPTGTRNTIYRYLHSVQPDSEVQGGDSIAISRMALKYRTNKNQMILQFIGSPLEDEELMVNIDSINDSLDNNIQVSVVLFGEAVEYYSLYKESIEESVNFTCVVLDPKESFQDGISRALRENIQETDPEIELAIQRSLQDVQQERNDPDLQKAINDSLQQ
ncbi:26S proteasome regulatory subunit N10 [Nematocida sp. AWRm77]|nr:26S proteasome regulatory subunit N10 [Nematocida sp. AWRm77]